MTETIGHITLRINRTINNIVFPNCFTQSSGNERKRPHNLHPLVFVIFPIAWSLLQALYHGQVTNQWQPLTLQGAGLFHMAMGAVMGVAAYGRTQEKIAGMNTQ